MSCIRNPSRFQFEGLPVVVRNDEDAERPREHGLLVPNILVRGDQDLEASFAGSVEQRAVVDPEPAHIADRVDIVVRQQIL